MQTIFAKNKIAKKHQAFSLIEVLFSVFLVSIGLLASMQLLTQGLRESMDSRDQIIAAGLAQEGVELVRNIRDNNKHNVPAGCSFDGIPNGDNCTVGKYLTNFTTVSAWDQLNCGAALNTRLYSKNNDYTHNSYSTKPTKFYRNLKISKEYYTVTWGSGSSYGVPNDKVRVIVSMVSWDNGNFPANEADCNTATKCAYAKVRLTSWEDDASCNL